MIHRQFELLHSTSTTSECFAVAEATVLGVCAAYGAQI